MFRVLDLNNSELANQWWQLYDSKTKRFYYYNVQKQKTLWSKPTDADENQIVFLLANRIIKKLTKQLELNENSLEIVLNEIKQKIESKEETELDNDLKLLNELFKQELNNPSSEFKQSFSSFLSTNSFSSLFLSNSLANENKRPVQPRTNPNYINVDLVDRESGSMRNTYRKVHEMKDDEKFMIKTSSRHKLNESNQSINDLAQVTLLLCELLNSDESNETKKLKIDKTPTQNVNKNLKLDAKNFSLSNCFLANLKENEPKMPSTSITSSCSLSRKKMEKKFSFLCSDSKKIENSKTSEDNLCDTNDTLKTETYLFSPSSTTSLADLNNFAQTEKHQRFKNLRRSFNKTPKFECKNTPTSLSYMIQSNQNKFKIDIENFSPQLARKPSEANLLIIKKNQIDLNVHHEKLRGFLFFGSKKKIPDHDLMIWTSQTIQKPLIKTNNKIIKKEACELFKLIQIYMGDRKTLINMTNQNSLKKTLKFNETNFLDQLATNGANDSICLDIMTKGWTHPQLRDELYLQIVKQTTQNLSVQSSLLGWQLMAVCLSFFPPTQKLYPFLKEYIESNLENEELPEKESDEFLFRLARTCMRRLEKINATGAKKGLKNPSMEEVILAKSTILNPSLFGASLEEIMTCQRKKCSDLQLPWIQKVLSEAVLHLNGTKTEGIFRVPGDLDEVNNLKVRLEQLWCSEEVLKDNDLDILKNITDPHLPASLLKLWYRELYDPLIPNELYDDCIQYCDQPDKCLAIIKKLPHLNRMVFTYLIKFLKVFAQAENVSVTKMDANNLSMVMAPNCLRCKSNDPKTIMENTKKEMQFIKTLIQHLDTSI